MDSKFENSLKTKLEKAMNTTVEIPQEELREDDELDLLSKMVKTTDAGKNLLQQQTNYELEIRKLEDRRQQLILKRKEFMENKKGHEDILKENYSRRLEAEQQIQVQKEECNKLKEQLSKLRLDLLEAEKAAERLDGQLNENRCFAEFMTKVSDCSVEFQTVDDVMKRFQTLKQVLNDLLEKRRNLKDDFIAKQKEEAIFNQVQSTELLKCTQKLSGLKCTQHELRIQLAEKENHLAVLEKEHADNLLQNKKIKMAIKNMYQLVIAFTKPTGTFSKTEDAVKQLIEINQFMIKWTDIVETLRLEETSNSLLANASQSQ